MGKLTAARTITTSVVTFTETAVSLQYLFVKWSTEETLQMMRQELGLINFSNFENGKLVSSFTDITVPVIVGGL